MPFFVVQNSAFKSFERAAKRLNMIYVGLTLSRFACFLPPKYEDTCTLTLRSSHEHLSIGCHGQKLCSVTQYCAQGGSFISQIPLSHTTHFLSYPLIDKTLFALQQHYLPRLSMVVGWRTTAPLRIEENFPLQPMNQTDVASGAVLYGKRKGYS